MSEAKGTGNFIEAKGTGNFMLLDAHYQTVAKRLPAKDADEFRKHVDDEIVTRLGLLEAAQTKIISGYRGPLLKDQVERLTEAHLTFKKHLADVEKKRVGAILELETKRREAIMKKPDARDPVLGALYRDRMERRAVRLSRLSHLERVTRLRLGGQVAQDDIEALAVAAEDGIAVGAAEERAELEKEIDAAKTTLADQGDPQLADLAARRGDYAYVINIAKNHAADLAAAAGINTWSLSDTRLMSTGQSPQLTGDHK